VANERIELRFIEHSRKLAGVALDIAQSFVTTFMDRAHGPRHAVIYQGGGRSWAAYWTKRRAVVVRELGEGVSRG
jgi:hypothetical protein